MALIVCEKLTCGHEGHPIVREISFSVEASDYLVIIGENGSGKTTLMRTILGLQKPLSGKITTGDGLRGNEIGYLPQQTMIQRDFPASVAEVVISGFGSELGWRPFYNAREKRAADRVMEKLGIAPLRKRCYRELSGGQQQRVLLARALCAAKKAILLDEPVTGLDPKAAAEMYSLIEKLNSEGMAVIMISHDHDAAVHSAKHILRIGKKFFYGTKKEYVSEGSFEGFFKEGHK